MGAKEEEREIALETWLHAAVARLCPILYSILSILEMQRIKRVAMSRTFAVLSILFTLLLAAILVVPGVSAQAPGVEWQKTYGGVGFDMAWSLIQTSDGGYAFAGESQVGASGINYAWLVKTDAYGNALWNKTYDGTFRSVIQTVDGGYAIAGMLNNDFLLVKTDGSGNGQWRRTYDPFKPSENQDKSGSQDYAWGLIQTANGGYAIVGLSNHYPGTGSSDDIWLVKTDANGNALWNKTYGDGGELVDYAYDVVQTVDGGYAIGGGTEIPGKQIDFWLIRTDAGGKALWNKTYGGADTDWLNSVIQTTDGGYALAGGGYVSSMSAYRGWLVKTDAYGNEQWNKTYGGTFRSLVQTVDGGYALAGTAESFGSGGYDFYLVKIDARGNEQWNETFGGAAEEQAFSVVQAVDGNYALMGPTVESYQAINGDVWLIKTNAAVDIPESVAVMLSALITVTLAVSLAFRRKARP